MLLTGLQRLHVSMRSAGIDRVHFQVPHAHLRFSGLFLADVRPYQLALLVVGHDIVLMFDVDHQYNVSAYIRDPATLEALKDALNLGKGGRALRVGELLREIDAHLPQTVSARDKPTAADVMRVCRHAEEANKIHFVKSTPHSRAVGHKVRTYP